MFTRAIIQALDCSIKGPQPLEATITKSYHFWRTCFDHHRMTSSRVSTVLAAKAQLYTHFPRSMWYLSKHAPLPQLTLRRN